ncbi:NarK family nitrate/nitrite MFS transporter [Colwellia sp. MSW7]|uniref:Nitrate/nitrite transporter n=1 Tax=Colwellia maritima TaxID=2912588 RepID=A0ABS9WZR0_9GAMM|nr:NarK family nitrate/nitrite MFS transporter [Colwellia maritima]MCI2282317.1 NarK family nitrate/nitrite MFS transporter [Colwellia maritima]
MSSLKFNLFSLNDNMKVLHYSWVAFFITFLVWFNHAPLLGLIAKSLNLTSEEIKTLLILNVALTIPARIFIGMATDQYGPRKTFSVLLLLCSIPCGMFALSTNFEQLALARFLLGFIGAGFVIGIRLVSEWFPANQLGTAEGIYLGWGNFGSAAAAIILPAVALFIGGDNGWRWAVGATGIISFVYSFVFYFGVRDTPQGATYFKPKSSKAMEVTSVGDFYLLLLMKLPLFATLALLNWKLSPEGVSLISQNITVIIYLGLVVWFLYEVYNAYQVNKDVFVTPVDPIHQYSFKQVAVLNVLYFATFGSELAVVSMLPLFFSETFDLDIVFAGLLASTYAFMNLLSRPLGGWISDKYGRKKTLIILTTGLSLGYATMASITGDWPLVLAVAAAMGCSFFVQAGEGAVFAAVPLIKRRLTGQIAGMTGAYGNVGAVCYLTVLSFVSYSFFFWVIAGCAFIGLMMLFLMQEPKGSMAEIMPDGSVELIQVD